MLNHHCLQCTSEITREDLRVIHVVGDFQELLLVTELTNSHAVTRFKKGSDWGLVGRTEKVSNVVRSGLLMSFRSLEDSDLSLLKVYIVSNCRAVKEATERDEKKWKYAHCDTTPCQLYRGRRSRHLEGRVTDGEDIRVKIHPPFLTFEDTLDTDRFYAPFRVEVSQNLWRDTTARLHLQLLEEIDDHTKESVSELILGRYRRQEGTDSGHSTPTKLQGPPLDTPTTSGTIRDKTQIESGVDLP
ncbi:uncharacterized protein LOC118405071 [Branchiostoma floridae]|uniref:Uncharacterized protein LOC118405071 n=1 Tax=Branchiostoma floridae TaxID=7739 RepID=A0A9J7K7X1_BRAFL|nr:uncharacterized protein LOC118405071 [Branchiostoma floridae]